MPHPDAERMREKRMTGGERDANPLNPLLHALMQGVAAFSQALAPQAESAKQPSSAPLGPAKAPESTKPDTPTPADPVALADSPVPKPDTPKQPDPVKLAAAPADEPDTPGRATHDKVVAPRFAQPEGKHEYHAPPGPDPNHPSDFDAYDTSYNPFEDYVGNIKSLPPNSLPPLKKDIPANMRPGYQPPEPQGLAEAPETKQPDMPTPAEPEPATPPQTNKEFESVARAMFGMSSSEDAPRATRAKNDEERAIYGDKKPDRVTIEGRDDLTRMVNERLNQSAEDQEPFTQHELNKIVKANAAQEQATTQQAYKDANAERLHQPLTPIENQAEPAQKEPDQPQQAEQEPTRQRFPLLMTDAEKQARAREQDTERAWRLGRPAPAAHADEPQPNVEPDAQGPEAESAPPVDLTPILDELKKINESLTQLRMDMKDGGGITLGSM